MLDCWNDPVFWKDLPPALPKESDYEYAVVIQYGDRYHLTHTRNLVSTLEGLLTGCPDRDMWYAYFAGMSNALQRCNYVYWRLGTSLKWLPPGTSIYQIRALLHWPVNWKFEDHWIQASNRDPDDDVIMPYESKMGDLKRIREAAREKAGPGRALRHDPNWKPVYRIWDLQDVKCGEGERFLYLAVVKGRYKIGITDSLHYRFKGLVRACPDRDVWFEYYRPMKHAKQAEQYIKAKFDLLYEWFDGDVDVDEVISIMVNYKPEWGVGPSDKERLLKARKAEYQDILAYKRVDALAYRDSEEEERLLARAIHMEKQNWRTLDEHLTALGMHATTEGHGKHYLHAKYHKPGSKPYTEYDRSRRPRPYDFGDAEAFRLVDLIAEITKRDSGQEFRWDMSKFWDAFLALLDPELRKRGHYHAPMT